MDPNTRSEIRRKANEERPAALVHFKTIAEKREFEEGYGRRKIVTGRCFDEQFLRVLNFPYLERFEEWGWMSFLTLQRQSYSTLVHAFFYNGKNEEHDDNNEPIPDSEEEDGFHTYLQRQDLRITHEDVWEALGQPREAVNAPVYEPNTFSLRRAARTIYEDDNLPNFVSDIHRLSFFNRILHFMVCQTINPRQGSYSTVTHEDAWIMMKIIQNRPPNLAALVMSKMKRTVRFNKNDSARGLLYGKLVSEVIDRKRLRGMRDTIAVPDTVAPFGPKTVKQTGFRFDRVLGRWVRIGEEFVPEANEEMQEAVGNENQVVEEENNGGEEENEGQEENEGEEEDAREDNEDEESGNEENGEEEGDHVAEGQAGGEEEMPDAMEEDEIGTGAGQESNVGAEDFQSIQANVATLRAEVSAVSHTSQATYTRVQRLEQTQYQILSALRAIQLRVGIPMPPPSADNPDA